MNVCPCLQAYKGEMQMPWENTKSSGNKMIMYKLIPNPSAILGPILSAWKVSH